MQAIKAPQVVQPSYVPKLNSVEQEFGPSRDGAIRP